MFRILHNTNFDFIRQWRIALVTVLVFVVPAIVLIPVSGFNYSIEFTGGTEIRLHFAEAPDVGDVRAVIADAGLGETEITTFGSPNEIRIRAQGREQVEQQASGAANVADQIEAALHERFGGDAFTRLGAEAIGPRVGEELRRNAIIATMIAFGLTLVYISWRFEWRIAVAAILATIHDVLATMALIKYANIEISLFVVGSLLTVIGYSMNDKVVVFDRIRENLRLNRKRPLVDIANASINETLPRTIMTGTTTLAALLAMIVLGGEVIRPFALILFFGILVGTFSSIWVASPLMLWIEKKWPRESEAAPKGAQASRA